MGIAAHRGRFCTLAAFERHWYAEDSNGLRTWALAGLIAIIGTQLLLLADILQVGDVFYLNARISLVTVAIGGILFGLGMSLVGTCAFGALVRAGGGSLAALVVTLVVGLAALMTQRGMFRSAREELYRYTDISLESAGSQAAGSLVSNASGLPLNGAVILVAITLIGWLVFKDPGFRKRHRDHLTAVTIGTCVVTGWFLTAYFADTLYRSVQIESASFVLPPGELLLTTISPSFSVPDYGIGMVFGVLFGALGSAALARQIRWEACDDARELGRHLAGASLMGIGGVMAGGCTIGQGLSGLSMLALSAPIALIGIAVGARIGLIWLIEGRLPLTRGT